MRFSYKTRFVSSNFFVIKNNSEGQSWLWTFRCFILKAHGVPDINFLELNIYPDWQCSAWQNYWEKRSLFTHHDSRRIKRQHLQCGDKSKKVKIEIPLQKRHEVPVIWKQRRYVTIFCWENSLKWASFCEMWRLRGAEPEGVMGISLTVKNKTGVGSTWNSGKSPLAVISVHWDELRVSPLESFWETSSYREIGLKLLWSIIFRYRHTVFGKNSIKVLTKCRKNSFFLAFFRKKNCP